MPYSPKDFYKKLLGKTGEKLVERYLKEKGYKIVATNYRTPFGEADLVALDGEETVFIEVKTRSGEAYGTPAEAVTAEKRKRYYKIAQYYGLKTREEPNARFDVAEVYADEYIEYIKNAF